MRIYLLLLLLIFVLPLSAQDFFVVQDEDGYVNVRDSNNQVIDKLLSGKAVFSFDGIMDKSWTGVEYTKGDRIGFGNVHCSKLIPITSFEKIPTLNVSDKYVTLGKDSIKINITKKKFSKTNRYFKYSEGKSLILIDDNYIWGTDGSFPESEYNSFSISFGENNLLLPDYAFKDLFEPNLSHTDAYYDRKNDVLYLTSMNGDGAGGYLVLWSFRKGIFEDRLVFHGF